MTPPEQEMLTIASGLDTMDTYPHTGFGLGHPVPHGNGAWDNTIEMARTRTDDRFRPRHRRIFPGT